MSQSFMKEKPVLPLVLSMSLPMVFSMLVNALYNIVDSFYVARISEEALTAVSLIFPLQNLVSALAIGFGIGINVVISISLGAGMKEKADQAFTKGVVLSELHGLICTVLCLICMSPFISCFTDQSLIHAYAMEYGMVVFAFSVFFHLAMAFEKIFQAVGRMKTSMVALLAGCVFNIILDPIAIFGFGPIPAMGIGGAAFATGLGQTLQLVVYLAVLKRTQIGLHFSLNGWKSERRSVREMYATGIPATLNLALPSVLITCLNSILSSLSSTGVLILGIYYKLQTFLYLTTNGFVQGMRPIIGYNYGAGEKERVRSIFMTVLGLSGIVMVIGTLICQCIPETLIGIYSSSHVTIQDGSNALKIISTGFIISTVSCTVTGALEGLGKGMPSLLISFLRNIGIMVPCAFLLSCMIGVNGVWMSFPVTECICAAVSVYCYRRYISIRSSEK